MSTRAYPRRSHSRRGLRLRPRNPWAPLPSYLQPTVRGVLHRHADQWLKVRQPQFVGWIPYSALWVGTAYYHGRLMKVWGWSYGIDPDACLLWYPTRDLAKAAEREWNAALYRRDGRA